MLCRGVRRRVSLLLPLARLCILEFGIKRCACGITRNNSVALPLVFYVMGLVMIPVSRIPVTGESKSSYR